LENRETAQDSCSSLIYLLADANEYIDDSFVMVLCRKKKLKINLDTFTDIIC